MVIFDEQDWSLSNERQHGVTQDTLWRWRQGFAAEGAAGLVPGKRGPAGPVKLTDEVVARIRELAERGGSLAAIGAETGVSTATVRVALGRRRGSIGWEGLLDA